MKLSEIGFLRKTLQTIVLAFVLAILGFQNPKVLASSLGSPKPQLRPEMNVVAKAVVIPNRPVLVRDIASLDFVDLPTEKAIYGLEVLGPLQAGETKEFTSQEIIRLLKEKIAQQDFGKKLDLTFFIPENVQIQSLPHRISELSVRNQIVTAFRSICADCQVSVRELRLPVIPDSFSFQDWALDLDHLKMSKSFLVPLVASSAQSKKTFWLSGQVKLQKTAAVANRKISLGEKITLADVKMELVDVSTARDALASAEDLEKMVAARYLEPYQPIFKSHLKRENMVTRGQLVKAISGNELFEVTSSVVAEDSGALSDTIRVRVQDGKKIISAQVIERGIVRIQ